MNVRRTWTILFLAAAVAAALTWRLRTQVRHDDDFDPPPPDSVAAANDVFALLVGCSEYPVLRELQAAFSPTYYEEHTRLLGPVHDVDLMHDVLRRYLGVPESNITVLAGWAADPKDEASRPTRAHVLAELDRLGREMKQGAHVFLLYSGHGAQQPDEPGGDEADGLDEILLPADAGGWDAAAKRVRNVITDDEISVRLKAIRDRGADVRAIFDCCHSGTVMRGALPDGPVPDFGPIRMRGLSPRELGIPDGAFVPTTRAVGSTAVGGALNDSGESSKGIAVISAVHSSEQAPELTLPTGRSATGATPHGLLTFEFAQTLKRYLGDLEISELFEHVRAGYVALPWRDASPVAEGDLSLRAVGAGDGSRPRILLRREGDRLALDAGSLRGLTVGSRIEVFRPGRFGDPGASLGRLVLTDVEPLRSLCGRDAGGLDPATVPDGAPACVIEVAPGGPPLRIAIADAGGAAAGARSFAPVRLPMLDSPRSRAQFPIVDPADASWIVTPRPVVGDGVVRYVLESADRTQGILPLEADGTELAATLERIRGAQNWRAWASHGPLAQLPEGVTAQAWFRRRGADADEVLAPSTTLAPGDDILLRMTNGTGHDVDVVVLSVDSAQHVEAIWPIGESCHTIHREEKDGIVSTEGLRIAGDGAGRESLVVLVAVRGAGQGRLDVGSLSGPGLDASQGGLTARQAEHALLDRVAPPGTTRSVGAEPVGQVAAHEFAWATSWGRFGIASNLLRDMTRLDPPAAAPGATSTASRPPGRGSVWRDARILRGDDQTADVLLLSGDGETAGEGSTAILIDEDGDAGLSTGNAADAARRYVAGRLPVEVAIVLDPTASWAAYPRAPGDSELGRVRRGSPATGDLASEQFDLGPAGWARREACGPWLSTAYIPARAGERRDARARIVQAIRQFTRPRRP